MIWHPNRFHLSIFYIAILYAMEAIRQIPTYLEPTTYDPNDASLLCEV